MPDSASEPDDRELGCHAQAGSREAFETLVDRYYARILQFVSRRVASHHSAQDLVQEVFVTAWRKREGYNPEYPYAAWLYMIARRRTATFYERLSRQVAPTSSDDIDLNTPFSELGEQEQAELVWRIAAARLNDEAYTMLWMMYRENMALADIAGALGRKESAVKVAVFRARKQLKKHFLQAVEVDGRYADELSLMMAQVSGGA